MNNIKDGFTLYDSTEYINLPEEPIEWLCHGIVGKQGKTLMIGLANQVKLQC